MLMKWSFYELSGHACLFDVVFLAEEQESQLWKNNHLR